MDIAVLFGWLASTFTTLIFLPQLVKAVTSKMTHDISMWMLIFSVIGNGFWFMHASLTLNYPLVTCASLIILLSIALIIFKYINDRKPAVLDSP